LIAISFSSSKDPLLLCKRGYSITRTNLHAENWHVGKHVASMWDKTMFNIHGCKRRENRNVAAKVCHVILFLIPFIEKC